MVTSDATRNLVLVMGVATLAFVPFPSKEVSPRRVSPSEAFCYNRAAQRVLRALSAWSRLAATGRGHFLFVTYLRTCLPRLCRAGFSLSLQDPEGQDPCGRNPAPGF